MFYSSATKNDRKYSSAACDKASAVKDATNEESTTKTYNAPRDTNIKARRTTRSHEDPNKHDSLYVGLAGFRGWVGSSSDNAQWLVKKFCAQPAPRNS